MRLYEITNAITPDKFTPGEVSRPRDAGFGLGKDQEELGSGIFATAWSTPQEPGTVCKIVGPIDENSFKRDAYYRYIQMLAKNDRFTSNPYFPKVFDVQVKKFPSRNFAKNPRHEGEVTPHFSYAYAVDMERLHTWNTLSDEEALSMGKRIFYNYETLAKEYRKTDPDDPERTHLMLLIMKFFDYTRSTRTKIDLIKDAYLKKSILLIRSLRNQNSGMFSDIHSGNIMVRRGPMGVQLVLTDPVAH